MFGGAIIGMGTKGYIMGWLRVLASMRAEGVEGGGVKPRNCSGDSQLVDNNIRAVRGKGKWQH